MKSTPFSFTIGQGNWADEIRYYTTDLNPDYWARFRPLAAEQVAEVERTVGRKLPEDFREFLRVFGCGSFPEPYGGDIYEPEDFAHGCHGHLFMILGSSKWASRDEQRRFYVTHGAYNPAPDKYTGEALEFEGVNLLDLLQIGTNGLCCYHQVYVGDKPGSLGYCRLTPEQTMEDAAPSFSEGLKKILAHHWLWNEPAEEDLNPPLPPFFEPE
jgi:hypothetical protein